MFLYVGGIFALTSVVILLVGQVIYWRAYGAGLLASPRATFLVYVLIPLICGGSSFVLIKMAVYNYNLVLQAGVVVFAGACIVITTDGLFELSSELKTKDNAAAE